MPKAVKFLVGIVSTKLIAVILGPEGSGIISQLQNILLNISVFANGGLTDGMVKQLSNANSNKLDSDEISKIIKTYAITIGITTLLVFVLGYLYSSQLTQYVFGNQKYHSYFLIGFTGLPILILSSSSFALLKANKNFKSIMYAEIMIVIMNFILFSCLIFFFKLIGAVIHITLSYFVTFLVYRSFAKREVLKKIGINFRSIIKTAFSQKYFRELFTFFSISIIVGFTSVIMDVSTRSIVATQLGIVQIGLYSPIVAWASLFTSFILPSLGIYLFPRLAETKSNIEITSVVNDVFRLMTFILIPFILIAITSRKFLIPLFYSNEFNNASIYLPFHFVGIFFTVWCYIFIQTFTPTGRIKKYFPIVIFQNLLDFSVVYLFVPIWGLGGWLMRFTITPLIMFVFYYIYWHIEIEFRFSKENFILFFYVIFSASAILIFRNNLILSIVTSVISLTLLWFIMKKQERKYIISKLPFLNFVIKKEQ